MGIIVVGVDGSGNSRGALDWALNEARLRGSSVRAVHAWEIPVVGTGEAPWALVPPQSYVDLSAKEIDQHARDALDREVEEALARVGVVIDVERLLVEGSAEDARDRRERGRRARRRRVARPRSAEDAPPRLGVAACAASRGLPGRGRAAACRVGG